MTREAPLILLVDDDPDFLDMTSHVLEAAGYRVATAPDPPTALDLLGRETPCLVVTDLMMTGLDSGFSLARQIKTDPRFRGLPVIVATAIASRLGLDFAPRTGDDLSAMHADAFLEKPVLPADLLAAVHRLLARRPEGEKP
ncbi:MAG TPA: response regulator [Planctomycetota bacterium]|nr:response regulator [Planctomycetota bacterium]HRR78675.1 response regulator [Planctomycetota bacterium]HRT93343.1 response regulator [Planctomycetota bacterium]